MFVLNIWINFTICAVRCLIPRITFFIARSIYMMTSCFIQTMSTTTIAILAKISCTASLEEKKISMSSHCNEVMKCITFFKQWTYISEKVLGCIKTKRIRSWVKKYLHKKLQKIQVLQLWLISTFFILL